MDVKRNSMHPLPTSQHFSATRTDDDITAAVNQFLHSEGTKLHGKTWQDTTADVTKWLGSQIQKEREGWRQKSRAAMQEIENHRREMLKYQTVIQESVEQLKLIVDQYNLPEEVLNQIDQQDLKQALPQYIECLSGILNSLTEEREMSLQILRPQDGEPSQDSLPNLLKSYIETLKHHAEKAHKEAKNRLESLEVANKHSHNEMQKMKKTIHRKQEEVEKLHSKLHEIKEVTMKKFKEVNDIKKEKEKDKEKEIELDEKSAQTELQLTLHLPQEKGDRPSTPSSLYSAPTPSNPIEQANIQISEEKLSKLRKSAKKLENSLNDALTQMDTFRKSTKPTKFNQSSVFGGKPFALVNDVPSSLKKEMKLLPSPLHTWTTKFEVNGPKLQDAELEMIRQQEKERAEKRQKAKDKRREILSKSQPQDAPTFRSLMKSLDEVKKNRTRNFKPVGQVTKCLRCNKLFTLNDNHKKACNYHPKGKERIEQYSDRGKLVKVTYVWKCCMMGPDNPGCSYGQHI